MDIPRQYPIGIVGILMASFLLERAHRAQSREVRRHWLPAFRHRPTFAALWHQQRTKRGLGSTLVVGTITAGIILLGVLVWFETHTDEPLLALRLFKDRLFRTTNIANFMVMGGMIGVIFLLPLFLQQLRGLSATQSGLTTFTQAIGMIVMARFASRLYPRIGPRRMIMAGMALTTVLTAGFYFVDLDTSLWWIGALCSGADWPWVSP